MENITSGVTPMGSGWANPRAPGLGCPFILVFQLKLPFKKVPLPPGPSNTFSFLVAKFS